MSNENGTETPRSDALSAAESLFGDTVADQTVAVAKEEDSKNETEQDSQGSEVAEDQTAKDEVSPPDDLKVVVSLKEGRATIGVQQPSSDPHIEAFDDPDLSGLTQEVSAVIERARARWDEASKHPAYARPAPATRRRPPRDQGSARASATEGGAAQDQPQSRLF